MDLLVIGVNTETKRIEMFVSKEENTIVLQYLFERVLLFS